MGNKTLLLLSLLFCTWAGGALANEPKALTAQELLKEYKTYSLARCITENYKSMGVDFGKLPLKDGTQGFIDIELGYALTAEQNNALNAFIKDKTDGFYKAKQSEGDLARVNLVIYDCVGFSQSEELEGVLEKLIAEAGAISG
ncbi:hypothetical protein [Leminorella grimontii]|uniref:hypothetical protein n=1 Tax=Leminorella grimontii TaxID=82981 RepID=UPI0032203FDE